MSENVLPKQFKDLESFAEWALVTERQRNQKRGTSTMDAIQAFYDAIFPRMEAIVEYLNQYPLDQMPGEAERLFHMTLSLAEIAPAVELFKEPGVPYGYDPDRLFGLKQTRGV